VADLRKTFLGDPAVNAEIKRAIEKGLVIPGICPFQAFAAEAFPEFTKFDPTRRDGALTSRRWLALKGFSFGRLG